MRVTLLLLTLILSVVSGTTTSAPVAEADRISVDIRRTTLIVNDAEKSLALYRDALGMKVMYDQMINSSMKNGETRKRRLVLLQANDDFIGTIGILEYIYPRKPQRQESFDEPVPGDPIIVINASDLNTRWLLVEQTKGVTVMSAPELIEYPRANGSKIRAMVSMIQDPDGYWLEINQLLDEPARSTD